MPAMTFVATALGISQAGAKPILVDVDPDSALIDPAYAVAGAAASVDTEGVSLVLNLGVEGTMYAGAFFGFAFPSFVMALVIQNIFGVQFENWFGVKPFNTGRKSGENFLELLRDITLPASRTSVFASLRLSKSAMTSAARWVRFQPYA